MAERTRKYLRFAIPIIMGFLLGLSFLVLLGKSQDSLAIYFPEHPAVYMSLQTGPDIVANKFYQRISQIFEHKTIADELMAELHTGGKNASIAVYGTNRHPTYVAALHLKENADTSPFEAILRDYEWDAYTITRRISGSKILLFSNDRSYIDSIRSSYGTGNGSLIALENISINEMVSPHDGTLSLRLSELNALLPEISEVNNELIKHQMNLIRFSLTVSKEQGNLIASNLQLDPLNTLQLNKPGSINRAFSLGHVDGVLTQVLDGIRSRYQTKNSVLALLSAYEANRPDTLSYIDYDNGGMVLQAKWPGLVPPIVRSQLIGTLEDLLAYGHSLAKTIYLPDGSPIVAVVKNTHASELSESGGETAILDSVTGEKYLFKSGASMMSLTKGAEDELNSPKVSIDGCMADSDVNFAFLDVHKLLGVGDKMNIGKLLILEHNMISSSAYPQISLCLY